MDSGEGARQGAIDGAAIDYLQNGAARLRAGAWTAAEQGRDDGQRRTGRVRERGCVGSWSAGGGGCCAAARLHDAAKAEPGPAIDTSVVRRLKRGAWPDAAEPPSATGMDWDGGRRERVVNGRLARARFPARTAAVGDTGGDACH